MKAPSKRVACECANCGKSMTATENALADGRGKYCSAQCQHEASGYLQLILSALPATVQGIEARTGLRGSVIRRRLAGMLESSLCHASQLIRAPIEWGPSKPDFTLCYDRGPGLLPDVPTSIRESITYFYRLMVMASMPGTQRQIMDITGLSQNAVTRIVRAEHAAGNCFIRSWRKQKTGRPMAFYVVGQGKDAPCNKLPMTKEERDAKYRARLISSGRIADRRARDNELKKAKKKRLQGEALVNALFGTPAQRKASGQQPNQ